MDDQVKVKEVTMFPDGRLDVKNAASYTGFSEKTLAMMRCEGSGPKYIKRGRVFYFREDLDAWIQSGRVSSTAQVAKGV
jgi:predicted DNA-binding transcriptional regulator AlpA